MESTFVSDRPIKHIAKHATTAGIADAAGGRRTDHVTVALHQPHRPLPDARIRGEAHDVPQCELAVVPVVHERQVRDGAHVLRRVVRRGRAALLVGQHRREAKRAAVAHERRDDCHAAR